MIAAIFNSLRMFGRGGGIAIVFKNDFKCKQLSLSSSFTSFELSVFKLSRSHIVLCATVCWLPKYNRDFVNDFSKFLAEVMPKYDCVLIVGDFNVNVCLQCKGEKCHRGSLNDTGFNE